VLREIKDWLEELACRAGFDGLPTVGRMARPAVVALCVCVGAWFLWGSALNKSSAAVAPVRSAATDPVRSAATPTVSATVTVHVVGEVRHPGVYELPGDARVRDAVTAAGGLLGAADESGINLARVAVDGEQIVVPRKGEATGGAGAAGGSGAGPTKVDLNTATAAELDALPGVGPATAAKIVADRAANGPFRSVDDLMRVSGIGPAKFDALKDLVRAN
jgi:competence protein ComEA